MGLEVTHWGMDTLPAAMSPKESNTLSPVATINCHARLPGVKYEERSLPSSFGILTGWVLCR